MNTTQKPLNRTLIKIVADTTNRKVRCGFVIFFLIALLLMYLLCLFIVPHTFVFLHGVDRCSDLPEFKGLCHEIDFGRTYNWNSFISDLGQKNQFMVVLGKLLRTQNSPELNLTIDYELEIYPVDEFGENKDESEFFRKIRKDKINIFCSQNKYECDKSVLVLYPQIDHDRYRIFVKFDIPANLKSTTKGMKFEVMAISQRFTNFSIVLRYTFLIMSFLSAGFYVFYFIKLPKPLRSFEHKFILFLSFSLFFFNDPFYAATILEANTFLTLLSTFFVAQFLSMLILLWSVMIQRIHKEVVRVGTQLLNKLNVALSVIGFAFLMITAGYSSVYMRFDPGFHANAEYPTLYKVFQIIFIFYLVSMMIIFLFNIYKIYKVWKLVILRHKIFLKLSLFFIAALFILAITGIYQNYDSNGIKIFLLFFLGNLYVFILQILWIFIEEKEFSDYFKDAQDNSEERQKTKGFNYFNDNSEIKIIQKDNEHFYSIHKEEELENQEIHSISNKSEKKKELDTFHEDKKSDSDYLDAN
jgi:hypothetical protein